MKFFSNEAKENTDDPGPGEGHDRADVGVAAVPAQRAGSPWSDTPAGEEHAPGSTHRDDSEVDLPLSDAEVADRENRDGTHDGRPWSQAGDQDRPGDHPGDDDRPGDGALRDEGTFDSPTAVEPATDEPLDRHDDDTRDDNPVTGEHTGTTHGLPATDGLDDHRTDDTRDDEPATDEPVDKHTDELADRHDDDVRDEGTFDSPTAVEPATGEPLADQHADDDAPAVVAATAPVPAATTFFTDGDSFTSRFRDIQLRFVDSPKEATAEAATLLGEAVDKLSDALRSHRDQLTSNSDDTEQLRVELRGYRDLLNRLTTL